MHRIYCKKLNIVNQRIVITDSKETHHLLNVLRHKNGDKIEVFSEGQLIFGTIANINKETVVVNVDKMVKSDRPNTEIILACAIPKKAKFETIIEKCTELGVTEIIPLKTARTELKLPKERLSKKSNRYREVAINASKQCKRTFLPCIRDIMTFGEALQIIPEDSLKLIPWLEGKRENVLDVLSAHLKSRRVVIFIGPEGDFTREEVDKAKLKGFTSVSLGNTTLKVDTAAMSVVGLVNFYFNR